MNSMDPEIDRLICRLAARPAHITLRVVAKDTGLGWHWLRALTERRIRSPGYEKVKKLEVYLDRLELHGAGLETEAG